MTNPARRAAAAAATVTRSSDGGLDRALRPADAVPAAWRPEGAPPVVEVTTASGAGVGTPGSPPVAGVEVAAGAVDVVGVAGPAWFGFGFVELGQGWLPHGPGVAGPVAHGWRPHGPWPSVMLTQGVAPHGPWPSAMGAQGTAPQGPCPSGTGPHGVSPHGSLDSRRPRDTGRHDRSDGGDRDGTGWRGQPTDHHTRSTAASSIPSGETLPVAGSGGSFASLATESGPASASAVPTPHGPGPSARRFCLRGGRAVQVMKVAVSGPGCLPLDLHFAWFFARWGDKSRHA